MLDRLFVSSALAAILVLGAPTGISAQTAPAAAPAPAAISPARVTRYDTEVFAELPAIEAPQLSPRGEKIAARIAVNGVQYFWVFSTSGGKPAIIALGDTDLNWWKWVNEDWLVVGKSEEWYLTRAFGVRADGGKLVKLDKETAGQNASDLIWVARDGTPRILLGSQNSIFVNRPDFWPRVDEIDVTNGNARRVQPGMSGVMDWYADGNGVVRMGYGKSDDGRKRRLYYRQQRGENFRVIDKAVSIEESIEMPTLFLSDPAKALIIGDDETWPNSSAASSSSRRRAMTLAASAPMPRASPMSAST